MYGENLSQNSKQQNNTVQNQGEFSSYKRWWQVIPVAIVLHAVAIFHVRIARSAEALSFGFPEGWIEVNVLDLAFIMPFALTLILAL